MRAMDVRDWLHCSAIENVAESWARDLKKRTGERETHLLYRPRVTDVPLKTHTHILYKKYAFLNNGECVCVKVIVQCVCVEVE